MSNVETNHLLSQVITELKILNIEVKEHKEEEKKQEYKTCSKCLKLYKGTIPYSLGYPVWISNNGICLTCERQQRSEEARKYTKGPPRHRKNR